MSSYTKGEQCSKRVSHDSWGTHQCPRMAVVEREGKPYCKVHDPEYIKAKNAERTEKFDKEWAGKKARWELGSTAIKACKSINPDNPQAVAESIKDMYEALKYHQEAVNGRCGLAAHRVANAMMEKAISKAEEK